MPTVDAPVDAARLLSDGYRRLREAVGRLATPPDGDGAGASAASAAVLPRPAAIAAALASLPRPGQQGYLQPRGAQAALGHIVDTVVPALNGQNLSGRYYGFVTGSTLPVAEAADNVVSALDQNLHVHLPSQTVATSVEAAALQMLADLFGLGGPSAADADAGADAGGTAAWAGRTFTTGGTASNVLGLALGREAVVGRGGGGDPPSVAELGLLRACREAGVSDIRILTSMGHSSLYKAASVVGLGRASLVDLPHSAAEPWRLSLDAVERTLRAAPPDVVHIVSVSAGEVNTGRFATTGLADMQRLRALADEHGAWIHVDGAFGLFARALPDTPEFRQLRTATQGLELADSIASDGHKLLNVPYDVGIFFTRHPHRMTDVFQNANAAYLAGGAATSAATTPSPSVPAAPVPSPMNIGIENSRRFRALPVYAVLLSEGRDGLAAMWARMVRLARGVRRILRALPAYGFLGEDDDDAEDEARTYIGVLFWAKDDAVNADLAARINASREMYVSATAWCGRPACRIAVSSWRVAEGDLAVVERVLRDAGR